MPIATAIVTLLLAQALPRIADPATLARTGKMRSFSPDSTNSGRGAINPAMSCISAQFRIPGT